MDFFLVRHPLILDLNLIVRIDFFLFLVMINNLKEQKHGNITLQNYLNLIKDLTIWLWENHTFNNKSI